MIFSTFAPAVAATAAVLFLSDVSSHMIMKSPTPYNLDIAPFVQVDPLNGLTHPFPCQNLASVQDITPVAAGGLTLVQFTGGAQHGGGSCQFSISYDDPAQEGWNVSAQFKTIYSIIGGCPSQITDESRNLPATDRDKQSRVNSRECGNDYDKDCIRQFLVPLPSFLKNGQATFAWTWHNKVGKREMYMNCAPVNIAGGTGDQKAFDNLPDIFVADIPNAPAVSNCSTGTASDHLVLNYPNPGQFGRILESASNPQTKPADYCADIPPASVKHIFQDDARTVQGADSIPDGSTATTAASTTVGTGITVGTVAMAKTVTSHCTTVTVTEVRSASTQTTAFPSSSGSGSAVTCSVPGALVCIGTDSFGICNWGWAQSQKLASGTKCVDGVITGESV